MPKKTKVLITGANGFIGSFILKKLAENEDYAVTGLVRETSDLFRLHPMKYNLMYASLNDPLEAIIRGFDVVIHTAARSSDWGRYEDFYRVNVEGTLNLLNASVKNGVERFIFFSSTVVYGFHGTLDTIEESTKAPFHNSYCITKNLAEEAVLDFKERIRTVVLRPSNVFGPLDTTFTYPLIRALERSLLGFPKGGVTITSPCFVKNLVFATEKAVTAQHGFGESYNITDGADIPWSQFLGIIAREMDRAPHLLWVPAKPLGSMAVILEKLHALFHSKKPPLITPYRIGQVSNHYSFSIEKARRLLSYEPLYTTVEGVRQSVRWYKTSLSNPHRRSS